MPKIKQIRNLWIILASTALTYGCTENKPRKPISVSNGNFVKLSAERNKQLNDSERNFILQNVIKETDSFQISQYGFWYKKLQTNPTDSLFPKKGDLISYQIEIRNLKNDIIYSKEEMGNITYIVDKEDIFAGLREGLKLMKVKEKALFIFPSQRAYGYYGDDDKIGRNEPLICEVEIQKITPTND